MLTGIKDHAENFDSKKFSATYDGQTFEVDPDGSGEVINLVAKTG
jgi:hypothetical protein